MSIVKFCETFGVGKTVAYKLLAQAKLAGVKCGRRTLVTRESAERWFSSLTPYRSQRDPS